jgi:hypothetical protein
MQHGLLHDVHSYQDYARLGRVSSSTLSICSRSHWAQEKKGKQKEEAEQFLCRKGCT